jgi:hypothetical protein
VSAGVNEAQLPGCETRRYPFRLWKRRRQHFFHHRPRVRHRSSRAARLPTGAACAGSPSAKVPGPRCACIVERGSVFRTLPSWREVVGLAAASDRVASDKSCADPDSGCRLRSARGEFRWVSLRHFHVFHAAGRKCLAQGGCITWLLSCSTRMNAKPVGIRTMGVSGLG